MPNPRPVPIDDQRSAVQSVLSASLRVTASYLKLIAKQQQVLSESGCRRRADDGNNTARRRPGGARLTDHYGRRCHDVDVERL